MIEFHSEGYAIMGSEFRIDVRVRQDEDGRESVTCYAWGREAGTCAWYWVSPKERIRLEGLGVLFSKKFI